MCSAISAVQRQQDFDHIHGTAEYDSTGKKRVTSNHLYESWVNQIDILPLLDTSDLKKGQPVISLLIVPLCTEYLSTELPPVAREQMSRRDLDNIVKLMLKRYRKIVSRLIDLIPSFVSPLWPAIHCVASQEAIERRYRQGPRR